MTRCTKNLLLILALFFLSAFAGCNSDIGIDDYDDSELESGPALSVTDKIGNADSGSALNGNEPSDIQKKPLDGILIVLDPGHGYYSQNYKEPVAPNSSEMKNAFATGTSGAYLSEAEFNLIIAEKIEPLLVEQGAEVYFTRSDENSLSNVERAVFANELNADLAVRIHADGNADETVSGISVLVPAVGTIEDGIRSESADIGRAVLDSLISHTGAVDRGLIQRSDLTGFNWSIVPVILVECGFMSNVQEDLKLSSDAYQTLIAKGIAEAIIGYYENF